MTDAEIVVEIERELMERMVHNAGMYIDRPMHLRKINFDWKLASRESLQYTSA